MKNLNKNLIMFGLFVSFLVFPFSSKAQVISLNTVFSTTSTNEITVYGSVNPNGITTTAWFEYSTDFNFLDYKETNHIFVGTQGREFPIKTTIKNLKADSIYYVRIVADNTQGTIKGNIILVTTNPAIAKEVNTQTITNTQKTIVRNSNTTNQVRNIEVNINQNNLNNTNTFEAELQKLEEKENTNLGANALFSNHNFLPNNFFGWLILLLIILAIISIIRRLLFF